MDSQCSSNSNCIWPFIFFSLSVNDKPFVDETFDLQTLVPKSFELSLTEESYVNETRILA